MRDGVDEACDVPHLMIVFREKEHSKYRLRYRTIHLTK